MWLRSTDNFANNPVVLNVCRTRGDKTRVLGYVFELMLYCASQGTDGFVPEIVFRDVVRSPRWRDALTGPPNGGTALLHRPGDPCECMKDRVVAWPATAADYYMHHYLAFNPTKDEYDVNRAKQAELRDGKLQAAVKARDLNLCRYCGARVVWADRRSSLGGVFDHVDPNLAAGAANLVVACRGCNSRKGHRTPDAAGMTLLAVPGAVTGDPGDDLGDDLGGDLPPTTRSGLDPTTHPPVRDGTGRADVGRAVGDAGPNGDRPTTGPPAGGPRRSQHPNPYHRSAITGADPNLTAGLPSPMDYDQADRELFDEYNNSREDDP